MTLDGQEPGPQHFDFRSTSFSGVDDQVIIPRDSPKFCIGCVVNVAVLGFYSGAFSISASSNGNVQLQNNVAISGRVNKGEYRYYTFLNVNPTAVITVTVTTITGDPDLFINAYKHTGTPVLPQKTQSDWHSFRAGGDTISISYTDKNFCFDCDYIIAVYGYKNTTYTLLVTSAETDVVRLIRNRPQTAIGIAGGKKYFRVAFGSSTEDMSVSLTVADTGLALMFVSVANITSDSYSPVGRESSTGYPDPDDPRTYSYSTAGSQDNVIVIQGNYPEGARVLITVKLVDSVHFSIVATTSQDVVLLKAGSPQNHFVSRGSTAYFRLPLAESSLVRGRDIQVTLTARSGDPDLIISSTSQRPYCAVDEDEWWRVTCFNATWTSRVYSTDQIIISSDFPCAPVLPSTRVSSDCDSAHMTMTSLYIGVFGFDDSKFILTASYLGELVQLLPGKPQLSATALGYICSKRSNDSGACLSDQQFSRRAHVSYFSFQIGSQGGAVAGERALAELGAVSKAKEHLGVFIDVFPDCHNASVSVMRNGNLHCIPGCNCHPLQVYVKSCSLSSCRGSDMYPSEYHGQHDFTMKNVSGAGDSLFISLDPSQSKSRSVCFPGISSSGCLYFVAVVSYQAVQTVPFSITARTTTDVSLIDCDPRSNPDGIRTATRDVLSTESGTKRYYEICSGTWSESSSELQVTADICYGAVTMFACGDRDKCQNFMPTLTTWRYSADRFGHCSRGAAVDSPVAEKCTETDETQPSASATFYLSKKLASNYFLLVNGTAEYELQVQSVGNKLNAPAIVRPGVPEAVSVLHVAEDPVRNGVRVHWLQSQVLLPGSSVPVIAKDMYYTLFVININRLAQLLPAGARGKSNPSMELFTGKSSLLRITSHCGLKYLATHYRSAVKATVIPHRDSNTSRMHHEVKQLEADSRYGFVLMATCDSACLRQLSKVVAADDTCNGPSDCKTQHSIYFPSFLDYSGATGGTGDEHGHRFRMKLLVVFSVLTVATIVIGMFLLYFYYDQYRRLSSGETPANDNESYELTEVQFSTIANPVSDPLASSSNTFEEEKKPSSTLWSNILGSARKSILAPYVPLMSQATEAAGTEGAAEAAGDPIVLDESTGEITL